MAPRKQVVVKKKGKKKVKAGKKSAARPAVDRHWFYSHEGETVGPFSDEEMCVEADEGRVLPTDVVWRDDDPDFQVYGYEVDDLFPDLGGQPPEGFQQEGVPEQGPGDWEPDMPTMVFQTSALDAGSVMCPYCWFRCEPEDVLYIARHPELVGDPILGGDEPSRFLPARFTPDGHAIDPEGVVTPDIACPRCHMRLARALLSMPPIFVSVVGAPASGKSYFITSMCWQLRRALLKHFLIRFTDADAMGNRWLNDYEERLFVQADEEAYQAIDKTQLQGDLYREILYNGMSISLPLPSVFTLQADESSIFHPQGGELINRALVLYDNAGEHFEPGRDSAQDPGTHHLIHSEAILFSYDPTKDPGFRKLLKDVSDDAQVTQKHTVQRQDVLLTEVINRVRLYTGLDSRERFDKPMIVMLSKADVLGEYIGEWLGQDPWRWDEGIQASSLDLSRVLQVSFIVRSLLEKFSPEIVSTVESFASDVIYVPVSALGHSPSHDPSYQGEGDSPLVVRPCDVSPRWVEVPLLYALFKMGLVSGLRDANDEYPLPEECEVRGGMFHFMIPGTEKRVRLPLTYAGTSLKCWESETWFRVPDDAV